jgi:DNA-directed RNA polymerase specialized sigma24 family protein
MSDADPRLRGDEAQLYEQFNRELVRKVRARSTRPELIEDACSFDWVQFMRFAPDRERSWRAWLLTTAEREAWWLHRLRRSTRRSPKSRPYRPLSSLGLDHLEDRESPARKPCAKASIDRATTPAGTRTAR